jgi:hypothetical protein
VPARIFILLFLTAALSRGAEMVLSQSRQFAIYGSRARALNQDVPSGSIAVETELLAITAERIRQAVATEIPAIRPDNRPINLHLLEQPTPGNVIEIRSTHFTDGWTYRVGIPPVVEETRLAKALIQALLIEFAQRAGDRGAEIPAWVAEGLAQELFYSVGPKLVVDRTSTGWEGALRDMNWRTRETLRTNAPPSFGDLTTLAPPPAGAEAEPLYQSSAHLLVRSLLQSPNGRQKFAAFLQMLPATWNWQTAFREAYGFESMLEVEKWWALVTVEFTSRDQRQAWSPAASLQKLDELLLTRVEFHSQTNSLPETRMIDLKTALRELEWRFQSAALNEKIAQIGYTTPHLAPEIGSVALQYQAVLKTYIEKRERATSRAGGLPLTPEAYLQKTVDETLRQIEALDAKRRTLAQPTVSAR